MSVSSVRPVASGRDYGFENVSQIPKYCSSLAALLNRQPLFDGTRSIVERCKVISLEHKFDAKTCAIFSANAKKIIGITRAWDIHDFGGATQLQDAIGRWIAEGVTLWLYDGVTPCPINELESAYTQVLERFTQGWQSAQLDENPDISFQEDPADYYLFIKQRSLSDEDELVRFLAKKFSMEESVTCYGYWENPDAHKGKIYLWIRKSAIDTFKNKFCFTFS